MAQVAYRFGLAIFAVLIVVPASAGDNSAAHQNMRSDGQRIPFSSISPDVIAPPGGSDPSDGDARGDGPDDQSQDGPPDDGAPINAARQNDYAIPA
ncbi:MAG TPA: hypothetical protein VN932_09875 [Rhizomicrobium sp.]|nr:hypothetical protein [Rhizomicrobium sp.]